MDVDSNSNNDFNNVIMQQDNHNDISLGTPEHVQSGINIKNIVCKS